MAGYIQVCDEEGEESMELPLEGDGTLLLSTLVAQFPGACGLKYRHPESRSLRGVRLVEERLVSPDEGWNYVFICTFPKENKRKIEDNTMDSSINKKRMEGYKCLDLIVLGLPWKTGEEELKKYFEQYGELLMAQIKKDPKTGQSKGFGFIRYGSYESQKRAMSQRHVIEGRVCDVKIPNSKEGMFPHANSKVFIGRCTEDITNEDLKDYFAKFGEVTDVFIPKPFRAFAFVTFLDPEVANMLCGEDHIIKGASVYVSNAAPKSERGGGGGSYGRGGGQNRFDSRNGGNWSGPNSNWNSGGGGNGGGGGGGGGGNPNSGGNWNNNSGGGGGGGGPMNWAKGAMNMNPLTMPMLAALSQASMGLLGSMQQQAAGAAGGGDGGGGGGGYQGGSGGGGGGGSGGGGGHWQQGNSSGGGGGGNWDKQSGGRGDRYTR